MCFGRRLVLVLVAALLPGMARSEIRLEPRGLDDHSPVTAVLLGAWRDSCTPSLRSVEREPAALATSTHKRITARLDAHPVGACLAALAELRVEIPLGILPSGRYSLDVLVDDPQFPEERYLDGVTFDVFAANERQRLALADGRFVATVTRKAGGAHVPAAVAGARTHDSGLFWFFGADNWELSVKLLDGCAINDHYWLLAAATTDVPWRLELTDRRRGERYGVAHEGGAPSPASIDVEAFPCDPDERCGSGVIADILASPRPDLDAERLAILLDGTVAARTATYERLARDLAEIHRLRPETLGVVLNAPFSFDLLTLLVGSQGTGGLAAGDGIDASLCLDARYGALPGRPIGGQGDAILLGFDATLDMRRVALEYAQLPGVVAVLLGRPGPLPQGAPQLCATREGDLLLYYLRALSPTAPAPWFFFSSTTDGGVAEAGEYQPGALEPAWLEDARSCLSELGLE